MVGASMLAMRGCRPTQASIRRSFPLGRFCRGRPAARTGIVGVTRQFNSRSVAGESVDTRRPVDAPFDMGSADSPGDDAVIGLTEKRAILRHGRLEGWRRIAGSLGVRHCVAELAVR